MPKRPGFPLKTFQRLRILRDIVGQKFQRDEAAKLGVLSLVDHTHAAATELLDDAVVRDGLADHAQACYGGSIDKSMKGVKLADLRRGC